MGAAPSPKPGSHHQKPTPRVTAPASHISPAPQPGSSSTTTHGSTFDQLAVASLFGCLIVAIGATYGLRRLSATGGWMQKWWWPPPGFFIAVLALVALFLTIATAGATQPPSFHEKLLWLEFGFVLMVLEIGMLYAARNADTQHKQDTAHKLEQVEAKASDILRGMIDLQDASGRPGESLRSRALVTSAGIFSLLTRPKPEDFSQAEAMYKFGRTMMFSHNAGPSPQQQFDSEMVQLYIERYAAKVIDLYDEIRKAHKTDDALESLAKHGPLTIENIKQIAERLGNLARQLT